MFTLKRVGGKLSEQVDTYLTIEVTNFLTFMKHKDAKFAEQFQEVLDKSIERHVDFAEDRLDELVRKGNVTAIIFTLKKLRPKGGATKSINQYIKNTSTQFHQSFLVSLSRVGQQMLSVHKPTRKRYNLA